MSPFRSWKDIFSGSQSRRHYAQRTLRASKSASDLTHGLDETVPLVADEDEEVGNRTVDSARSFYGCGNENSFRSVSRRSWHARDLEDKPVPEEDTVGNDDKTHATTQEEKPPLGDATNKEKRKSGQKSLFDLFTSSRYKSTTAIASEPSALDTTDAITTSTLPQTPPQQSASFNILSTLSAQLSPPGHKITDKWQLVTEFREIDARLSELEYIERVVRVNLDFVFGRREEERRRGDNLPEYVEYADADADVDDEYRAELSAMSDSAELVLSAMLPEDEEHEPEEESREESVAEEYRVNEQMDMHDPISDYSYSSCSDSTVSSDDYYDNLAKRERDCDIANEEPEEWAASKGTRDQGFRRQDGDMPTHKYVVSADEHGSPSRSNRFPESCFAVAGRSSPGKRVQFATMAEVREISATETESSSADGSSDGFDELY
ncbi:uncharacterized protein V1518DRAFT_2407 [Limtongia smithiae]|uniref:uncharacterized protein n=1 Tax=Limtongia smithiae TaxID=1125753 RepID=UPI0034CF7EA4